MKQEGIFFKCIAYLLCLGAEETVHCGTAKRPTWLEQRQGGGVTEDKVGEEGRTHALGLMTNLLTFIQR